MKKAAQANLDTMETQLDQVFNAPGKKPILFVDPRNPQIAGKTLGPNGQPVMVPNEIPFQSLRNEIKILRDQGERAYKSKTQDMAKQAALDMRDAARMEADIVRQMRAKGLTKEAAQYESAISQYAADNDAIRFIRAKQAEQALPGGANPQDRPGLEQADKDLKKKNNIAHNLIHGTLGVAKTMLGHPAAAGYHGAKAAQGATAGPLKPQQRYTPSTAGVCLDR
jgi:hypothetical protein